MDGRKREGSNFLFFYKMLTRRLLLYSFRTIVPFLVPFIIVVLSLVLPGEVGSVNAAASSISSASSGGDVTTKVKEVISEQPGWIIAMADLNSDYM